MFNTVSGNKITFLGWAFKKDTNDARESAAIYVAWELLQDKAEVHIYDPNVSKDQIYKDINKLLAENSPNLNVETEILDSLFVHENPYSALKKAHANALLTEWDEFVSYDWETIYSAMFKPAFVFLIAAIYSMPIYCAKLVLNIKVSGKVFESIINFNYF